jgi:hypothetical protein
MAKKPEATFWDWLDRAMGNLWDAQRHEDLHSSGIPDVSYGANGINGWLELKAYECWPTGTLPHFTAKQVNWLTNRGKRGGFCFLVIKVHHGIFVFNWENLEAVYECRGKDEILKYVSYSWIGNFSPKDFLHRITSK